MIDVLLRVRADAVSLFKQTTFPTDMIRRAVCYAKSSRVVIRDALVATLHEDIAEEKDREYVLRCFDSADIETIAEYVSKKGDYRVVLDDVGEIGNGTAVLTFAVECVFDNMGFLAACKSKLRVA